MFANLSLGSVTKFAQDVLNDSAFNMSGDKEHLSDEEEDYSSHKNRSFYDDGEDDSFNVSEHMDKLQKRDQEYEKVCGFV